MPGAYATAVAPKEFAATVLNFKKTGLRIHTENEAMA
jgi:hypothetical protein